MMIQSEHLKANMNMEYKLDPQIDHEEMMLDIIKQHDFLLELIGDKSFIYVDIPVHGNIGDLLIMQGTLKFFEKNNLAPRIVAPMFSFKPGWIKPDEIVIFHGGGNFGDLYTGMHELRERVIQENPHNRIIILPQTIHFSSAETMVKSAAIFQQHKDVHLCVRDEKSYELAKQFTKHAYLVPDMAHHLFPIKSELPQAKTTLLLSRTDLEKTNNTLDIPYTTVTDWPEVVGKREKNFRLFYLAMRLFYRSGLGVLGNRIFVKLWAAYASALIKDAIHLFGRHEYIVTDRLHGHILSSLMSKPHTLLDNSYGKNSGYFKVWTGRSGLGTLKES